MQTCLYGTKSDNVAGYCRHHHCALTPKQIKCKNCLGKQCYYLIKNEEHDWWRQREVVKQKRKYRKQILDAKVANYQ
jgi:hypothetical protein